LIPYPRDVRIKQRKDRGRVDIGNIGPTEDAAMKHHDILSDQARVDMESTI